MDNDEKLLINRFSELAAKAYSNGCYTYSGFLTLAEQQILFSLRLNAPFELQGGFDGSERAIAVFGSEDICGYQSTSPVVCVKIKPVLQKFADSLSHRDCLGSLMALGIKREVLGDIILNENEAYLFCLESVSDFIVNQLEKVKHTSVKCEICTVPSEIASPEPKDCEFVVASTRLDGVIAAVYNLSRGDSQRFFEQKKVFISGKVCENTSHTITEGDIVSVRGIGRFRFDGVKLETKKGKLRIKAGIY